MNKRHVFWDMVDGRLPMPPAEQTLGFKFMEAIPDSGQITLEFDAKPEFCNVLGNIGGGFLDAMLDATTSLGPGDDLSTRRVRPDVRIEGKFHQGLQAGKTTWDRANDTSYKLGGIC